jgi:hypothetical protein
MRPAHLAVLIAFGLALAANEAAAVIGNPATPVSVAGAARRTTRRDAYAAGVAAGSAGTITTLPAGCTEIVSRGVAYQKCGATYYRPYYRGTTVVYAAEAP